MIEQGVRLVKWLDRKQGFMTFIAVCDYIICHTMK